MNIIYLLPLLVTVVFCNTLNRSGVCDTKKDGSFIKNPLSRASYFYCKNEKAYVGNCPNSYKFNGKKCKCVLDKLQEIVIPVPMDGPSNETIVQPLFFMPNPQGCSKYYVCEGTVHEKTCPDGFDFNFDCQGCDWPKYAKCPFEK